MAENNDEMHRTWRVFTGTGEHDPGRRPPAPPPWRTFPVEGPDRVGRYIYLAYPRLVNAINLAICLRRPLLLTGQAGVGKSSVAEAVAHELALGEVLRWNITSRSTLEEGLYRYDALGRLQHQQLHAPQVRRGSQAFAATHRGAGDALEKFLRLGPLGTALISARQRVLLIDELDKSDIDLPGDLLNVLERGQFEIPELARHDKVTMDIRVSNSDATVPIRKGQVNCALFPMIVITSNGEREFAPAFLRRCIRERMEVPNKTRLVEIVRAHLPDRVEKADRIISDFAKRLPPDRPAALAIDQLLNTVLMMTRDDAPADGPERQQLMDLLQKELRES